MMLIVKTKRQTAVFERPAKGAVFVQMGKHDPHKIGPRLTERGGLKTGRPVVYSGHCPHKFERICKRWLRDHLTA